MNTLDALKKRRSCRKFSSRPLAGDTVIELIDCARLAPTARNVQPWEFVAVSKKDTLQKIADLAETGRFIANCACCVAVLCADTKYYLEDGCAATVNIMLAATDLGLGSCWVAGDKKDYAGPVKSLLGVAENFKLVSLVALGYPEMTDPPTPVKRQIKDMTHWEKF